MKKYLYKVNNNYKKKKTKKKPENFKLTEKTLKTNWIEKAKLNEQIYFLNWLRMF